MSRDTRALLAAIEDAATRRAKTEAAAAIAELRGRPFDGVTAITAELALKGLTGQRWFDLAALLGKELADAYSDARGIRRRFGQALIERGELAAAREQFERLHATPGLSPSERAEYTGLTGRTFKQQFVNTERQSRAVDAGALGRAIDTYLEGYRSDPAANTWHGINAVALLKLAQRRGVRHPSAGEADAMATDITNVLTLAQALTHWDEATLAEAFVALGQWEDAAQHLRTYLWYPGADAFAFGSTLRQFEEIWEIADAEDPGTPLVMLLRARLLELENGCLELRGAHVMRTLQKGAAQYEKVFGADHFTTLNNYRMGLERCGPVGRIQHQLDGGGGTGFLMRGSDLDPRLGAAPVLVTNAHVIDPDGTSDGLAPGDVVISFHALEGVDPSDVFKVPDDGVIWSSPREKLDVTIVRLDAAPPLARPYPVFQQAPKKGSRVIAIGHPAGGMLSLSLNDNELLDVESPGFRMHYRTPTEGGSSGSPIFTKDWKLVSLHHAGGDDLPRLNGQPGTHQANEGISIVAIREALAAALV
jgi:hypothetical protein